MPEILESFHDTLGALTATSLAEQTPDEGLVALGQTAAPNGFLGQVPAGLVEDGANIAGALGSVLFLRCGQFGVHDRDDDALCDGVVDERLEGVVTGVTHDRDAVRLGGHGLGELADHLARIPVGPLIVHVGAEQGLGCLGAVVDDGREAATLGATGEEDDVGVLAELRIGVLCRDCGARADRGRDC